MDRHFSLALAPCHGGAGTTLLPGLSDFTHIRNPTGAGGHSFAARAPAPTSRFHAGRSANRSFMLAQHGPALAPTLASIRAHLFLATSHAILAVRIPRLSVVLPRIHQLHHVLQPPVPPRPVHDLPCCIQYANPLFSAWATLRSAMGTIRGSALVALGTVSCIVAFVNLGLRCTTLPLKSLKSEIISRISATRPKVSPHWRRLPTGGSRHRGFFWASTNGFRLTTHINSPSR